MDDDLPDGHVWWEGPVRCSACGHRHACVIPIPRGQPQPTVPIECLACRTYACRPLPNPERN